MSNFQGGTALKSSGECWTWGLNTSGQLGDLSATNKSSPVSVVGAHLFTQLTAALNTMAGLKSDGSVWTWGSTSRGILGDNQDTVNKSSPISVVGSHSFTKIASNRDHVMGLKSDGTVWSWGSNWQSSGGGPEPSGQIGDNSTSHRSSPVSVVGAHSFVEISLGAWHSMGRKNDGTVWTWGMNATAVTTGQLGDNTGANKSSPVSVVGAHSFVEIAGGYLTSYGRKSDGTVWSWGYGAEGQLGDNTLTTKSSPVSVVGAHSFVEIAAGGDFILARKTDGTVWAWGNNSAGNLGDQSITNRSSPVSVVGGHSFVAIWAAANISFGRKANGEVWGWGANNVGQIGDWTLTNRSSPVAVVGSV